VKSSQPNLVRDLLALVERHGPTAIHELARLLSTPDLAADLAVVLRAAADLSPSRKKERRPTGSARTRQEDSPPASHDPTSVTQLERQLGRRAALPTLADILTFAEQHDLDIGSPKTREKGVAALMRRLRQMAPEQSERLGREAMSVESHQGDDALSDWSRIILPKDRKGAGER
jgi:hypothetical protein